MKKATLLVVGHWEEFNFKEVIVMRLADIEVGKVFRTESTGILTSTSLWNL